MIEYIVNSGTYIKDSDNSFKINLRIILALIPFLFLKLYYINLTRTVLNLAIIYICIVGINCLFDYLKKEDVKLIPNLIISLGDSMIITIIAPHNVSVLILIISLLMGYIISKIQACKFKKIIINAPILCSIIAILLMNLLGTKLIFGTTNNNISFIIFGISLMLLSLTKTIKWKIPVVFITTFAAINYMVMGYNNLDISFVISQIFACNLLFYALISSFFKNSPVTPIGQILYGLLLGIVSSVLVYIINPYIASIVSILLVTTLINSIDRIGAVARFDFSKSIWLFTSLWLLIIVSGLLLCLFKNVDNKKIDEKPVTVEKKPAKNKEQPKIEKSVEKKTNKKRTEYQNDVQINIEQKEIANGIATYQVGYEDDGYIEARIVINNGIFKSFVILEHNQKFNESDGNEFISKLLYNQNNTLNTNQNNYSSITLKSIASKVLDDFNGGN